MNYEFLTYYILAEAYGTGYYSCGEYNEGCSTTQDTVGAPDTGLFAQPAYILYPTLLGVAVVIGVLSYLIARQIKKLRKK